MQNKLQELTDKIYQEGLEKGNAEAKIIVDKAKEEAQSIIELAKKEVERIKADAQKNADELKLNTESEIKLSSKQALNALKQEIVNIINNSVSGLSVKNTFNADFTRQIVETTLKNWSKEQTTDLEVLLPESQEKQLQDYFITSLKELLDKGLKIKFDSNIKSGFQIVPKDGNYKLSFTEDDFANFFKQYLRPRLIKILFE